MQLPVLSIIIFTPIIAGLIIFLLPKEREKEIKITRAGSGSHLPAAFAWRLLYPITSTWRATNLSSVLHGCHSWEFPTWWAWMEFRRPMVLLTGIVPVPV